MSQAPRIARSSPAEAPARHPHEGCGAGAGPVQLPLNLPADATIAQHVDGIYRAWQEAVDEAGGTVWLAASLGKSHPDVGRRVRHEADDKHDVKETTLKMVGHIGPDAKARLVFLAGLCELWGCEPPQLKRVVTEEQIGRATLEVLEESGKVGEAIKQALAKKLRCDVGALRR